MEERREVEQRQLDADRSQLVLRKERVTDETVDIATRSSLLQIEPDRARINAAILQIDKCLGMLVNVLALRKSLREPQASPYIGGMVEELVVYRTHRLFLE